MLSSACEFKEKEVKVLPHANIGIRKIFACGIRNPGNFSCGIRNPRLWNPNNDLNSNPNSTDKESGIQFLESGIHDVESRIQDCPGFPYKGRYITINVMSHGRICNDDF